MATTGPQIVPAGLVQKYWDTKLVDRVEGSDIFSGYKGALKGNGMLPGTVIVSHFEKGKRSGTVGLLESLSGTAILGRNTLSGNEETLSILDFEIAANEVKHGVAIESFGVDAVADSPYNTLGKVDPLLGDYMEKTKGKFRRQALCQCYSENLAELPSDKTQHISANLYVGGVALASQPVYSDTLATYSTAINTACPDAATAANQMTQSSLMELAHWVKNVKRIKPLASGKYILTVPANQRRYIMDPDSGIAKHWSQSNKPEMAIKGWIADFDIFHLVEDERAPIMVQDEDADSVTWTYTSVNDSRPVAGANNWDVAYVLGADAIMEYECEKLHYQIDDTNEYGRDHRVGAFATYGDQIIQYVKAEDTLINQGSAVVLFASLATA